MGISTQKKNRVLDIFYRAIRGEEISIKKISDEYGVSTKSVSRDIAEIKMFLLDCRDVVGNMELTYSYKSKSYHLEFDGFLQTYELVIVIKILIGSRALDKSCLLNIIEKIKKITTCNDRKILEQIIRKEVYHYNAVNHDCENVVNNIWKLTQCIIQKKEVSTRYYKTNRQDVTRRLLPVAIIFSDYYFYLIAYRKGDDDFKPLYYRVDRIVEIVVHRDKFTIDDRYSFDEGELKEKIQFMFPGKFRKIVFEFSGPSVQAVLDKLPTAKIIEVKDKKFVIEAEIYGKGVNMYLLSQGSWIRPLSPKEFVDEMKEEVTKMYKNICEIN